MRMQVQRQGAIVHQNFAPDTEFAVVAPLKQTSELLQELADMDRCKRSSLHVVCMRRRMPMLRGHTLLHSRVAGFRGDCGMTWRPLVQVCDSQMPALRDFRLPQRQPGCRQDAGPGEVRRTDTPRVPRPHNIIACLETRHAESWRIVTSHSRHLQTANTSRRSLIVFCISLFAHH